MRIRQARIQTNRLAVFGNGFVKQALISKRGAEIVVRAGVIRLQADGLKKLGARLIHLSLRQINNSECVVRLRKIGFAKESFTQMGSRLIELFVSATAKNKVCQIELSNGGLRFQTKRWINTHGLRVMTESLIHSALVQYRRGKIDLRH